MIATIDNAGHTARDHAELIAANVAHTSTEPRSRAVGCIGCRRLTWNQAGYCDRDQCYQPPGAIKHAVARRLAHIIEHYGGDTDVVAVTTEEAPKRYALVEVNVAGSTPPYWVTTHDTPSDAAAYSVNQEYASDWGIERLFDLHTGERVQTTTAVVVDVTFP